MDGSISASGIRQKDPHVGGVTNSWAENEARSARPAKTILTVSGKIPTGSAHDGTGEGELRYVAQVPNFHIWQEKTSRPMVKPIGGSRRIRQAPSVTPASMSAAAATTATALHPHSSQ
jgi:hypothetical protein